MRSAYMLIASDRMKTKQHNNNELTTNQINVCVFFILISHAELLKDFLVSVRLFFFFVWLHSLFFSLFAYQRIGMLLFNIS